MIYNRRKEELPKPLESFARGLVATTCLTVACGATAMAGTIVTEGTPPGTAPYFPTSPNGYLLPVGTTEVVGILGELPGETGDFTNKSWFEFQGLTPGGSYTITGLTEAGDTLGLKFLDDSGTPGMQLAGSPLDLGESAGGTAFSSLSAPADGKLVVEMFSGLEGGGEPFQVNLTQNPVEMGPVEGGSTVPEPSTIAGVGLGLGAFTLAWRRKRPQ